MSRAGLLGAFHVAPYPGVVTVPRVSPGPSVVARLAEVGRHRVPFSVEFYPPRVASFPEGHPRAADLEVDTVNLIAKLRAGAEYSITQMFFDVDAYLRLRDRVQKADRELGARPIIPGIMPITSLRTVRRQVELSGSQIPAALLERLTEAAGTGPEENRDEVRKVGIELATEMSARLLAEGVPCLHFCTLNFARATIEVLSSLGVNVPA